MTKPDALAGGRVVNMRSGEPYDVYVGRPSKWGNPFKVGRDGTREEVIAKYREYLLHDDRSPMRYLHELVGKTLACWCAPLPCHADVLVEMLELARPTPTQEAPE